MRGERSCQLRLQLARPSARLPNSPPAHSLNSLSAHFPFFPAVRIGFLGKSGNLDFLNSGNPNNGSREIQVNIYSRNQDPSHPKCGPGKN